MKTIVFCNHLLSLPLITDLQENQNLLAVVIPLSHDSHLDEIRLFCALKQIPLLPYTADSSNEELISKLVALKPEIGVIFTFPHILAQTIFDIPLHGSWNLHGSPLPKYRGADPVFWQIANGVEKSMALCLHRVSSRPDKGDIFDTQFVELHEHDTKGTCMSKLAQLAPPMITQLHKQLDCPESIRLKHQDETKASYQPRPTLDDITIQWNIMSAQAIHNLVRATNPDYSGAITWFRGSEIKIIETDAFETNTPIQATPGSCIDAAADDPNLYVVCAQQSFIRINIAAASNIIGSGVKIKKLFNIKSGESFSNSKESD